MPTFTFEDVETAAQEKSECFPWGYRNYKKDPGSEWYLDNIVLVDHEKKTSEQFYCDGRLSQIWNWS